jgi:LacI family transcriptional regulator
MRTKMEQLSKRKKAVTIKDVAKKAGVAVGTVSRYINGYNLRDDKRKKVCRAIQELGFKGNYLARGLKKKRSMTVGALVYGFMDTFSLSIVNAFSRLVEAKGYSLIISDYENSTDKFIQKIDFLREKFVDGLVVFPTVYDMQVVKKLNALLEEKVPVIIINENVEGVETDNIIVDNANASLRAVENLIHNNHVKIGIINGLENEYVSIERLKGYREALRLYNIPENDDYIKFGHYTVKGGYLCTSELLQGNEPPTALYVTNYSMTNGALMAIRELNMNIPEDISIIGFDYTEVLDVISPALTVVEQPVEKIGEAAARIMIKRIKGDYSGFPEKLQINTRLLLKDSVRKL